MEKARGGGGKAIGDVLILIGAVEKVRRGDDIGVRKNVIG